MCENLRKSKTSFSRSIFLNRKSQNIKRHNTFWWFMRFLCGTNNWEKPIFTTIYLLIVPQSLNINGILFPFFYITNSLFWYRISYFQTRNFSPFFFFWHGHSDHWTIILSLLLVMFHWENGTWPRKRFENSYIISLKNEKNPGFHILIYLFKQFVRLAKQFWMPNLNL